MLESENLPVIPIEQSDAIDGIVEQARNDLSWILNKDLVATNNCRYLQLCCELPLSLDNRAFHSIGHTNQYLH
jgi:hypothetical protein